MKKLSLLILSLIFCISLAWAGIDMQAHVASDDGRDAYKDYVNYQMDYYTGNYAYEKLFLQRGTTLFGSLNTLMGNTCKNGQSGYDYGELRYEYVNVDRDLNKTGNIIGFYNGVSMSGTWGSGWNREHTWPQSKGANKNIPMGHDMQSVRPTQTSVNSSRGNDAFGESGSYYDPNEISISNSNYNKKNNGTYRGDCARVIMYDYIVYGKAGSYSNSLYNGNAQLLSKLGTDGLFESVEIMLKWHMQDHPSLTEMVRNDGGENYQGNRNPFIDYPELAIMMLEDEVSTYAVACNQAIYPNYPLTTKYGFVAYLTNEDGSHPTQVEVTGATGKYEKELGRLTVTNVTGKVTITSNTPSSLTTLEEDKLHFYTAGNTLYLSQLKHEDVRVVDVQGRVVWQQNGVVDACEINLPHGIFLVQVGTKVAKVVL